MDGLQRLFINKTTHKHSQTIHFFLNTDGKVSTLIVYVDDIAITRDDVYEIEHLKHQLSREFEMKDLGKLRYFWAWRL